jgi:molybdate transport system ATP-binding protein
MIDIRVRKTLGDFTLDIAFRSEANVTALVGPSGSGKSSVIGAVAGLLRPEHGHIGIGDRTLFDSESRVDVPAHRRDVRVVFQESRLFPHLSVRQNLLYGYWLAGGKSRMKLDQIVTLLGIDCLLARRPRTLSGGERQRVALGRALLACPAALLMDEPLASLDQARKDEVLPYLKRLVAETSIPILYVSHQRDEIERLAECVVTLDAGQVVNIGKPGRI